MIRRKFAPKILTCEGKTIITVVTTIMKIIILHRLSTDSYVFR